MKVITRDMFVAAVGAEPLVDDLDRCNCPRRGMPGHMMCGWDEELGLPRFLSPGLGLPVEWSAPSTQQRPEPETETGATEIAAQERAELADLRERLSRVRQYLIPMTTWPDLDVHTLDHVRVMLDITDTTKKVG